MGWILLISASMSTVMWQFQMYSFVSEVKIQLDV